MRGSAILLLPLLLVPPAAAAEVRLEMDDERGAYFFRDPATGLRNPVLAAAPGETLSVTVVNVGSADHHLVLGPPVGSGTPCCQAPGETAHATLAIPADAPPEIPYFCSIHRQAGMAGVVRLQPAGGLPAVAFVSPAEGATVPSSFLVEVRVENFTLLPPREDAAPQPGRGHVHYTVNGTRGLPGWDTNETRMRVAAAGREYHLLRAELVDEAHRSLDPPVFAERLVFVDPSLPPQEDAPTPTAPTSGPAPPGDEDTPGPGLLTALAGAALAAAAARRRR